MKMMIFGKVIGGLIGLAAGGVVGLIFGLMIGHAFDRSLGKALLFGSPENIERIKESFFETTFLLSGYVAKADGRISKSEIDHTEQFITQMSLSGEQRQRAIDLFRRGAAAEFELEPIVVGFLETCGPQRQLQQTLLLFLISLAQVDQGMEPAEHAALVRIAGLMGLGAAQLELLLRMARAQDQFHRQGEPSSASGNNLDAAYTALGVERDIGDKELKQAYRRLMSEHHPDKLIAKGVPEDMIKMATTRAQEIQAAYEVIKKTLFDALDIFRRTEEQRLTQTPVKSMPDHQPEDETDNSTCRQPYQTADHFSKYHHLHTYKLLLCIPIRFENYNARDTTHSHSARTCIV